MDTPYLSADLGISDPFNPLPSLPRGPVMSSFLQVMSESTVTSTRRGKKSAKTDRQRREEEYEWELEKARNSLEGPAFTPFRMSFWKPAKTNIDPDKRRVTMVDTARIFLSNALQIVGLSQSVDGAPVVEVGTYKGSFTTFLSKVLSGRLEELAGGPLFLLLAEYRKKYGPVYKLMFGPR